MNKDEKRDPMSANIEPHSKLKLAHSVFDESKYITSEGKEIWSARDLMFLFDYVKWETFEDHVRKVEEEMGADAADEHVEAITRMIPVEGDTFLQVKDYRLTRYSSNLVAKSCDGKKLGVVLARIYFEAKVPHVGKDTAVGPRHNYGRGLRQIAERFKEEALLAEARAEELEEMVKDYREFMDSTGTLSLGVVAKILGMGQKQLFSELRDKHILIKGGGMKNTPYRPYMKHFEVRPSTHPRKNGSREARYTTKVRPSGIAFIREKLDL